MKKNVSRIPQESGKPMDLAQLEVKNKRSAASDLFTAKNTRSTEQERRNEGEDGKGFQ